VAINNFATKCSLHNNIRAAIRVPHAGASTKPLRRRSATTTTTARGPSQSLNSTARANHNNIEFVWPYPQERPTIHNNNTLPRAAKDDGHGCAPSTTSTIDNRLLPPPLRAVPQQRQRSTPGHGYNNAVGGLQRPSTSPSSALLLHFFDY
jgi:hypothetical protein